ncbi:MAG: hypothetical protein EGP89_01550 [Ruminococcaceae bacterium]|nr:hypothetical protein [Oscillospiraceae bacterium]
MIGTQAVIFRSRKISRAAVFDKSGDNPEQWQKQPPRGAAVLFVTHRAVWHEIGGSRLPKISTMGEAFFGRRESVRKGFSRREFSHEKRLPSERGGISPPRPLFWRQYPRFYCAKMPAHRSEEPAFGGFGQNRKNHRP